MKPKVYIETTIISLLASKTPRDLIAAAHQQETLLWWENKRQQYDLFTSDYVLTEITQGDAGAAEQRLSVAKTIPLLAIDKRVTELASHLLLKNALPQKAMLDALHVAIAATNGMDFLLSWNCKHIVNANTRPLIEACCRNQGYEPPVICTPTELLGGEA